MLKLYKNERFYLIELLVVLAIIAIRRWWLSGADELHAEGAETRVLASWPASRPSSKSVDEGRGIILMKILSKMK